MKYFYLALFLFFFEYAITQENQESQVELRPRVITKDTFTQTIDEPSSGTFVMYHGTKFISTLII